MRKLNAKQKRGSKAHRLGQRAETLAGMALWLKLYRVIARRYKTKLGEIDIIAARGRSIVFVEVKARPHQDQAAGAISAHQQERLARTAQAFIAQHPQYAAFNQRFDVMLVSPWHLPKHIVNAF